VGYRYRGHHFKNPEKLIAYFKANFKNPRPSRGTGHPPLPLAHYMPIHMGALAAHRNFPSLLL
jgi:hypothetical protein